MSAWQDIASAPYDVPVEVEVEDSSMIFGAVLRKNISLTSDERPCDQWQATGDRYPRCWSEGACWESNADEQMSRQPTRWRAL